MGPIPWSKVLEYAEYWQLNRQNTETLMVVVRHMDAAFYKWQDQQSKSKSGSSKPATRKR